MYYLIAGLLAAALLVGCASSNTNSASDPDPAAVQAAMQAEAAERFGADAQAEYLPNETGTYMLVRTQTPSTPQQPIVETSYFVYALDGGGVTGGERRIQGTVAWADPGHVRVQLTPGTVPAEGGAATVYLVEAATGARMPAGE